MIKRNSADKMTEFSRKGFCHFVKLLNGNLIYKKDFIFLAGRIENEKEKDGDLHWDRYCTCCAGGGSSDPYKPEHEGHRVSLQSGVADSGYRRRYQKRRLCHASLYRLEQVLQ